MFYPLSRLIICLLVADCGQITLFTGHCTVCVCVCLSVCVFECVWGCGGVGVCVCLNVCGGVGVWGCGGVRVFECVWGCGLRLCSPLVYVQANLGCYGYPMGAWPV